LIIHYIAVCYLIYSCLRTIYLGLRAILYVKQTTGVSNQVPQLAVAVGGLGDGLQAVAGAHRVGAGAGRGVAAGDRLASLG
jgi:hypothetical protein